MIKKLKIENSRNILHSEMEDIIEKINELITSINYIQRTLDDQDTYNMEMKERGIS